MACAPSLDKFSTLVVQNVQINAPTLSSKIRMSIRLVHSKEESRLVADCLKGKRASQELLYKRFAAKMHGVCHMYTRDGGTADEILQEGFIKVFRNLSQFNQKGSLEGWVRRTMVNTAIDFYRKNHHQRNMLEIDEISGNEELFARNDGLRSLENEDFQAIIQHLPQGYKTILNLAVMEGYTHKEIGEMLGISEGTSKSQLSKAKRFLRNIIDRYVDEEVLNNYAQRPAQTVV